MKTFEQSSIDSNNNIFTVVFGQFEVSVNDTDQIQKCHQHILDVFSGEVLRITKDHFIIAFVGPSCALNYALELRGNFLNINTQLKIGIDIRECELNKLMSDYWIDFMRSMLQEVPQNQIITTDVVRLLSPKYKREFLPQKTVFNSLAKEFLTLYTLAEEDIPKSKRPLRSMYSDESLVNRVKEVVLSNNDNDALSVQEICREVGISERHLQRKLREIVNKSPVQFVSHIRLDLAKKLLMTNAGTVSEAAFKTGFTSLSYFSKCFRKEFGINPSDIALMATA